MLNSDIQYGLYSKIQKQRNNISFTYLDMNNNEVVVTEVREVDETLDELVTEVVDEVAEEFE